jgi:hypothetical protein
MLRIAQSFVVAVRTGRLLIVLFFVLCSIARADVVDDNPAAAALASGDVYVFARGGDGAILYRHLSNGAWGEWAAIPGLVSSSGPAAAELQGTIQVFARGPLDAIWQSSLQDGRWSPWVKIDASATSAPSVTHRRGTQTLDLAVRGADNAIWHRSMNPASSSPWSAWDYAGGNASSAASAVSIVPGYFHMYIRGAASLLGRGWEPSSGYFPDQWTQISSDAIVGAPAAVSRVENRADVVFRGNDRALWQVSWEPSPGWSASAPVDPQPVDSSPGLVSDHPSRIMLFARVGEELWTKTWSALPVGAWSAWSSLGKVQVVQGPPDGGGGPVAPVVDADHDGVPDAADRCVGLSGPAARSGCPSGLLADPSIRYRPARGGIRVVAYYVKATTGARVGVTCSRGCKRTVVKGRGSRAVRIKGLNGRRLKNGTKITVTASLARRLTTTVVDRVSHGRRIEGRPVCSVSGTRASC